MDVEMFFSSGDSWGEPWVLDVETVESLRFGPPTGRTDLEVAVALTQLLYDDVVSHGTNGLGRRLDDDNVPVVMKAHRTVFERLALKPPVWPFRTFDGWRGFGTYWRANGMSGSGGWQARRDCIEQILGPTRDALEDLQELEYERRLNKGPSGALKNLIFAGMVAEVRRLRLAGYKIYRFGGYELTAPGNRQLLEEFFTELLARHQRPTL
ncbi:hypothetical protein AB0N88_04500 [Streptomyces sp. NPDC093516]|uniref:hypothetical protein n=1 Tax=Streptomyces sp. NPDC093516 TaxID=3155304 RepID=UPI00343546D7